MLPARYEKKCRKKLRQTFPMLIDEEVKDVCVVRKGRKDECDFTLSDETSDQARESIDDDKKILRAGQQDTKFKAAEHEWEVMIQR